MNRRVVCLGLTAYFSVLHFVATAAESWAILPATQAEIDTALARWEKKASETKAFKCHFTCLTYDPVFHPSQAGKPEQPVRTSDGTIYYAGPDRTAISESEARRLEFNPATGKREERPSSGARALDV